MVTKNEFIAKAGILPSAEDQDLVDMVHEFVVNEIKPTAAEYDKKGELNWDAFNKAYDMGLICPNLPAEYGGQGLSQVTCNRISEELVYGDAGFALTCGANNLGIKAILLYGTPEQKKLAVETVVSDKPGRDPRWPKKRNGFIVFALTEPNAGSDAAAVATTAVKSADGSEYVLNGRKCFITNAPYADLITVIASTDKTKGYAGLSMFLVDAYTAGISVGKHEDKMGIRQSATSDILFEDAHIPASCLVGQEGEGFKLALAALAFGRGGVGANCAGIARAAMEEAAKYAQQRCTKGKPIYKQQVIAAKLADMQIAVETMRAIGMKIAACIDAGEIAEANRLGPIAKCYCSDALQKVVTEAVQILGGYGYMRDYPVEKLMRDAKIYQIFEGTNEIQRSVISAQVISQYKL